MGVQSGKAANLLRNHMANPFLVLDLPADASTEAVERKGELLLSMLSLGVAEATNYQTPFGPRERTAEMVREALAELRDPNRRLIHEWWIRKQEK